MKPTVSIIVTTAQINLKIVKLLESIAKQTYKTFELIIIEHGFDKPGKLTFVPQSLRNKIRLLNFKDDLGFCKANNIAAQKAKGEYLFFANDDVVLDPDCLKELINCLDKNVILNSFQDLNGMPKQVRHDKVAVIQPKIRSSVLPNFFEYAGAAGGLIDKYGYCFCRGRIFFTIEEDRGQYDKPTEVFWATGAAFFIKKDLFNKFGGFDERFFAYHEETDLCWRLRNAGYKIVYEPNAIVYHLGENSWKYRRFLKIFLIHRNHYWLLAKNHSITQFISLLPIKIFLDLVAFFYYAVNGDIRATLASIIGSSSGLLLSPWFIKFYCHAELVSASPPKSKKIPKRVRDDRTNELIYPGSIAVEYFLRGNITYMQLLRKKPSIRIKLKQYGEFQRR